MQNNQINYDEVRLKDIATAIRRPEWSGQDVLERSLNMEKSDWVIRHLNDVRVWPKGIMGYVKKFRCVLKGLTSHSLFENTMTICVLLNTIAMAMDRYGLNQD